MMEKTLQLILDKLDNLENRFNNLEHEQKRQADILLQLVNNVAATNVKISETNERLDKLTDDVKEIKASMATKKDLEYYDQMISEHSREIYKLKNT